MMKHKEKTILEGLFNHITKPSKEWPQSVVGNRIDGKTTWTHGGVDDEFRDYLVIVEKYLKRK
jgi:hypothetical protein